MGVEAVLRFLIFYNMLTTVFGGSFSCKCDPNPSSISSDQAFRASSLVACFLLPAWCLGTAKRSSAVTMTSLYFRDRKWRGPKVKAMTPSLARFFKDSNQKSLDCRSFPGCQMWCRPFARSDHVCFVSGLFLEGLMPGIPLSVRHFVETLTFDLPKLAWHGLTRCKAMGAWANHGYHICSFENRAPQNPMASQHGPSPSCHVRGSIFGQTQASPKSKHLQSLKWQHGFEGRRMRGAIRHHLDVGALAPGHSKACWFVMGNFPWKSPNHGKEYPKHPVMNS